MSAPHPKAPEPPWRARLAANLERVRQRIGSAARAAGRAPDSVALVAVTKAVEPPLARALVELGQRDLGENRDNALATKVRALEELPVRWHFIGHLQRNKVKRVVPRIAVLHSLDSLRLVEALAAVGPPPGFEAFLEVQWTDDPVKTGLAPEEVASVLEAARRHGLSIRGLMSMGVHADAERTARIFSSTRELARDLEGRFEAPPQLSMGMSADLELAIEAGAHVVRVGSDLFDGVDTRVDGAGESA
ncbi:MAG: YggS family pyridoxal phosphate-dependent enzyme [Planctomycetota bacterium]